MLSHEDSIEIDVGGGDRQSTPRRHRVSGIDREIDDHLLELGAVGTSQPQLRIELDDQVDVLAKQADQHGSQPVQYFVGCDQPNLHHLAAAESKERSREAGGPVCGPNDFVHIGGYIGDDGIGPRQLDRRQLSESADGGEYVVEIVSDASGQPAHRLHPLRLGEFEFQGSLAGYVAADHD